MNRVSAVFCFSTVIFCFSKLQKCVSNPIKSHDITIAAGIHSLSQYIPPIRTVAQVFIPEDYKNDATHFHDIAILRLEYPLELKTQPTFSKTCLSNIRPFNSLDDVSLVSVGWLHSIVEENAPNTLQQVSIKSISNSNSACFNSIYDDTYQFCSGLMGNNIGKLNISYQSRRPYPLIVNI